MMRIVLALALLAGICASAYEIANADDKPAQDKPAQDKPAQDKPAQDKPPQEMSAADTAKWLGFFDKLVATVVKSSTGCAKMAADVNAVIDANQDAIDVARAAHAAGRKLPQAAQLHMMEGVKKMVPGMQKCGQDDRVRAAFSKLDLTRNSAAARR